MTLLQGNLNGYELIMAFIILLWLIPIVLIIIGLVLLKSKPRTAKILLIIGGIWLLIGLGFCGSMML